MCLEPGPQEAAVTHAQHQECCSIIRLNSRGVELSSLRTTISIWVNKILHTIFVKFSKFHKLGQ